MTKTGFKTTGHFKIPANITPERRVCFCIEIPDDPEHFAIFWGLFNRLAWRAMWGEPLTPDSEVIAAYWGEINRKNRARFEATFKLPNNGCGCDNPTNTRITAAGMIEVSFDGGQTWEELRDEPRFNAPVFPPLVGVPGPTLACAGAKSGREAARIFILRVGTSSDVFTAVSAALAFIISFISSFLPIFGTVAVILLSALALFLVALGQAAFNAVDWPTELDTYMCILFCHISGQASFSEAAWNSVKADINQQLTGIAHSVLWNWTNFLGPVGLTNVCRAFPGLAGDCGSCACDCDNPTLGEIGENLIPRPDLGVGWWQVTTTEFVTPGCEPNGCFYAEIATPACCLHNAYVILPPGVNAPPGNRQAVDCNGVSGFANYGLGGCVTAIAFRSFGTATFQFQLLDCPP